MAMCLQCVTLTSSGAFSLGGMNVEITMISNGGNEAKQPAATFSKVIDGKPLIVRVFFPSANAEMMQKKVERMLRMDILKDMRKMP